MTQETESETSNQSAAVVDLDAMTATKETLEDYTLRFAPRSYRRWSTAVVGISALGGIAYLADFAIGANIGISYGTGNALCGIGIFALAIFATGLPLAYYAARYNLDLDLITRGSGFGYYGSVVTNVIFASFTFIFFALEGSIMAQGLKLGLHIPLWVGYACSTLVIFPLVIYGMKVLSQLQLWTTPLWLILMVVPFGYLVVRHPDSVHQFAGYAGRGGDGAVNLGSSLLAAGVCLSLIAQIAEQIDYLRFMPPRTPANLRSWWTWVLLAGPGWVVFGAIKQIIGLFLAGFYANCGIAWVVAVASDIVFNKYLLKLSPKTPEFRRGMLYAINPVGFGSMLLAAGLSIVAFFGGLGTALRPYSPLVAIVIAAVMPPIVAVATKGRYYLRRPHDGIDLPMYDEYGNPSAANLRCHVCHHDYERPDVAACQTHGAHVCSLCLSTDKLADHVLPAHP